MFASSFATSCFAVARLFMFSRSMFALCRKRASRFLEAVCISSLPLSSHLSLLGAFYLLHKKENVSAGKKIAIKSKLTGEGYTGECAFFIDFKLELLVIAPLHIDSMARQELKVGFGALVLRPEQFPNWFVLCV